MYISGSIVNLESRIHQYATATDVDDYVVEAETYYGAVNPHVSNKWQKELDRKGIYQWNGITGLYGNFDIITDYASQRILDANGETLRARPPEPQRTPNTPFVNYAYLYILNNPYVANTELSFEVSWLYYPVKLFPTVGAYIDIVVSFVDYRGETRTLNFTQPATETYFILENFFSNYVAYDNTYQVRLRYRYGETVSAYSTPYEDFPY